MASISEMLQWAQTIQDARKSKIPEIFKAFMTSYETGRKNKYEANKDARDQQKTAIEIQQKQAELENQKANTEMVQNYMKANGLAPLDDNESLTARKEVNDGLGRRPEKSNSLGGKIMDTLNKKKPYYGKTDINTDIVPTLELSKTPSLYDMANTKQQPKESKLGAMTSQFDMVPTFNFGKNPSMSMRAVQKKNPKEDKLYSQEMEMRDKAEKKAYEMALTANRSRMVSDPNYSNQVAVNPELSKPTTDQIEKFKPAAYKYYGIKVQPNKQNPMNPEIMGILNQHKLLNPDFNFNSDNQDGE